MPRYQPYQSRYNRAYQAGVMDRSWQNKRMKTQTGRYTPRAPTTFKNAVTQVLMKKAETKKYQFADENIQLYHNIGFTTTPLIPSQCSLAQVFNIWADINKGTGRMDRIGDKITPRGMSLNIWLANKRDRPNLMYRIIVATTPKSINGTTVNNVNVDPWDDIQLGSNGNKMIRPLDKDRGVKALYDKVFTVQSNVAFSDVGHTRETHMYKKLWIKSKRARDIVFDSVNNNQIVNRPLHVWVIPYDSYGTLTTDNIASIAYQGTIYYKDV